MTEQKCELSGLRQEIDAIDEQIIRLLINRTAVVAKVGEYKHKNGHTGCPIRPGREATMLRRITEKFAGSDFPPAAAAAIWRMIIGASTSVESPLSISAYAADKNNDLYWLAREYFGPFTPASKQPQVKRVIGDVTDGKAAIGILPPLSSSDETLWWASLLAADAPKIFAHIPFVYTDAPGRDAPAALAIAKLKPEATGNDISILVIEADANTSQSKLQTALIAEKIEASWIHIATPNADTRQHVVEIKGFVTPEHAGFKAVLAALGAAVRNVHYLGAYAVPITLNT